MKNNKFINRKRKTSRIKSKNRMAKKYKTNLKPKGDSKMFKITFIIVMLLTLSIGTSNSQVSQEWASTYNGPGNGWDELTSMKADDAGNVYAAGWSIGSGSGPDYIIIKYNSAGAQLWAQRYNGPGNASDIAWALAIDDSGNVYVTGESSTAGTTDIDYATIKYNSSGVLQWVQRYAGPAVSGDWAYSIAVDKLHNVYVTGGSTASGTSSDYVTIRYNSAGVLKWVQRYNNVSTNGNDIGRSITCDTSGFVYVTGNSDGSYADYLTIKYDTSGAIQWLRRYDGAGGIGSDMARTIAIDNSGNVYVGGYSWGDGSAFDYAVIKYNSSGDSLWVRRYNGPANSDDRSYQVAISSAGDVYAAGGSLGSSTGFDFAAIKYNSSGVQQWVQRYNGPLGSGTDDAYSITIGSSGNVYITGRSMGSGTNYDIVVIKYNSSGVQQWAQRYNGAGNGTDWANVVFIDASENVYVSGTSTGMGSLNDCITIKYSQLTGVINNNNVVKEFTLLQNYPNPFNPATKIGFKVAKSGSVRIVVFDILGKQVAELINKVLQPGSYEVEWNASVNPSGVYFYKLTAENFDETRKMILLK